jgi:hypothetical protein
VDSQAHHEHEGFLVQSHQKPFMTPKSFMKEFAIAELPVRMPEKP